MNVPLWQLCVCVLFPGHQREHLTFQGLTPGFVHAAGLRSNKKAERLHSTLPGTRCLPQLTVAGLSPLGDAILVQVGVFELYFAAKKKLQNKQLYLRIP